jgi:peptidoglycan/xylan/chitin deacetylase (PgdA/CDA1 family)
MRAPILLYHWFDHPRSGPGASPEFAVRPAQFRRQMEFLVASGRTVVSLSALVRALRAREPLGPRPVAITFDDAYEDFHEHAYPVLAERKLEAALFVVAGLVGRTNLWDRPRGEPERRLLDWPRLRELAAAGVEIGSHSMSHPDLRRLTDEELEVECRGSREAVEDGLGRPVRFFAYPHGRYDRRVKRAVRAAGYEAACAVLLRPWDLFRSDDFALMRAIVHGTKGFASFRARVRLAAPAHQVLAWR